uniref:Integral membrane protein n=1 Tax=Streptomyces sp. NBC_00093 TaxID=2975649 RepID=A0AAU2A1Q3_9ACTN
MTPRRPQPSTRMAGPADLQRARAHRRMLREELPRVREAALAWRNGLAALLAALLGFGLIKGRSDIGQLERGWAVAVGWLLLLSLLIGAVGALALLHAAHGRPRVISLEEVLPGQLADHDEARRAARRLRQGIVMTLACTVLLVAAVAATWYGPEKGTAQLRISIPGSVVCGTVEEVEAGVARVKTDDGVVSVRLSTVRSMAAVAACPKA